MMGPGSPEEALTTLGGHPWKGGFPGKARVAREIIKAEEARCAKVLPGGHMEKIKTPIRALPGAAHALAHRSAP